MVTESAIKALPLLVNLSGSQAHLFSPAKLRLFIFLQK